MASPLDVGLLSKFSIVFSMIFIFAIVYAILTYTKLLGDNRGINALIALITALLLLFSPNVAQVINIMTPWFVVLLIFILLVYLLFRFMGASEADMANVLKTNSALIYVIIVIATIIFLAALGKVFFSSETAGEFEYSPTPQIGENGTVVVGDIGGPPGEATFWATLFHPKVLGMIFILLIAMFTLMTLAVAPKKR